MSLYRHINRGPIDAAPAPHPPHAGGFCRVCGDELGADRPRYSGRVLALAMVVSGLMSGALALVEVEPKVSAADIAAACAAPVSAVTDYYVTPRAAPTPSLPETYPNVPNGQGGDLKIVPGSSWSFLDTPKTGTEAPIYLFRNGQEKPGTKHHVSVQCSSISDDGVAKTWMETKTE